jgi:hypothetical protein
VIKLMTEALDKKAVDRWVPGTPQIAHMVAHHDRDLSAHPENLRITR